MRLRASLSCILRLGIPSTNPDFARSTSPANSTCQAPTRLCPDAGRRAGAGTGTGSGKIKLVVPLYDAIAMAAAQFHAFQGMLPTLSLQVVRAIAQVLGSVYDRDIQHDACEVWNEVALRLPHDAPPRPTGDSAAMLGRLDPGTVHLLKNLDPVKTADAARLLDDARLQSSVESVGELAEAAHNLLAERASASRGPVDFTAGIRRDTSICKLCGEMVQAGTAEHELRLPIPVRSAGSPAISLEQLLIEDFAAKEKDGRCRNGCTSGFFELPSLILLPVVLVVTLLRFGNNREALHKNLCKIVVPSELDLGQFLGGSMQEIAPMPAPDAAVVQQVNAVIERVRYAANELSAASSVAETDLATTVLEEFSEWDACSAWSIIETLHCAIAARAQNAAPPTPLQGGQPMALLLVAAWFPAVRLMLMMGMPR